MIRVFFFTRINRSNEARQPTQEFAMLRDMQDTLVGGAKVVSQYASELRSDKRLFNAFELRLFRYTAVLLCLVVLTALIGSVV